MGIDIYKPQLFIRVSSFLNCVFGMAIFDITHQLQNLLPPRR